MHVYCYSLFEIGSVNHRFNLCRKVILSTVTYENRFVRDLLHIYSS